MKIITKNKSYLPLQLRRPVVCTSFNVTTLSASIESLYVTLTMIVGTPLMNRIVVSLSVTHTMTAGTPLMHSIVVSLSATLTMTVGTPLMNRIVVS